MLGGGKDIRPRSGRMGYGIHGTGMAMVGKIRRNSPFIAPRLKRQDRLFSKDLSDPPHGGTIMSESMRMQSQLAADLEVYRAKGELIALRAENATLRQLLEDVLHTFGYLRFHRVAGMDGLLYETHNKMSPERTVEACEKRIRATLTPAAGGTRHGTN